MNKFSVFKLILLSVCAILIMSCNSRQENKTTAIMAPIYNEGTYGYDVAFFKDLNIETIELKDTGSNAMVLVIPGYQGRVMTSASDGYEGQGFGWIKYDLIKSGKINPQFNPFGGEERLWLGPEGGKFSIYFKKGEPQEFSYWKVPAGLDTEPFEVVSRTVNSVKFKKDFNLVNYSGTSMNIGIERSITVLSKIEVEAALGFDPGKDIKLVAFQSDNTLINKGEKEWTEDSGVLSIWMLSMFKPSKNGVVVIPFKKGDKRELGEKVSTDYFGEIPQDRLIIKDDILFFKVDGKFRSKIGISPLRALPYCGSYDPEKKLLTVLWYSAPENATEYVNSKWGNQDDPLKGDVINAYNDGPVEDGSVMGPFYEIESSSPAAKLKSGERITHTQRIYHFVGNEEQLDPVSRRLFGMSLSEIMIK